MFFHAQRFFFKLKPFHKETRKTFVVSHDYLKVIIILFEFLLIKVESSEHIIVVNFEVLDKHERFRGFEVS